jgi:hypothetical protein
MMECFFTNLQVITIAELKSARRSVRIAVAWINFDVYYPILSELVSRGGSIRIIVNHDRNNQRYVQQIESLKSYGVKITLANVAGIMHHKFCIIDEHRCLFGSYNWTNNAELKNIENLNICDEPHFVYNYLKEFDALEELSQKDLRLLRNPEVCTCCGEHIMNILVVEQEGYNHTKLQMMQKCGCGCDMHDPEYYDIAVYYNYLGIIDCYEGKMAIFSQLNDGRYNEELKARLDFDVAMYWAKVRNGSRFGFDIVHAVGVPGTKMFGRHDEELIYRIIWRERHGTVYS